MSGLMVSSEQIMSYKILATAYSVKFITVYFNPNQPSVAVLKTGLSVSAKIFYGITGFAFVILIFIFGRIAKNPLTALITEIR